MERIVSLQYLRAFAALAVVAFHAMEGTQTRFLVGAAGVDVFFVISGFIMGLLIAQPDSEPSAFLWRRVIRIVPLYWALTILAFLIAIAAPALLPKVDPTLANLVLSLLFIPHGSATGVAPVLEQGWSLEYEMAFYLICACVMALAAPARRIGAAAGVLAALALVAVVARPQVNAAAIYASASLIEFIAGLALAALWRRGRMGGAVAGGAALVGGLVAFSVQAIVAVPPGLIQALAWGVPAIGVVYGALALERAGRMPTFGPGLALGDASYALYLAHTFVIAVVVANLPDLNGPARLLVCSCISVAVALGLYQSVERPLHERLKRLPPWGRAPLPISEGAGSVRRP